MRKLRVVVENFAWKLDSRNGAVLADVYDPEIKVFDLEGQIENIGKDYLAIKMDSGICVRVDCVIRDAFDKFEMLYTNAGGNSEGVVKLENLLCEQAVERAARREVFDEDTSYSEILAVKL